MAFAERFRRSIQCVRTVRRRLTRNRSVTRYRLLAVRRSRRGRF